jgi:hypothetical protein
MYEDAHMTTIHMSLALLRELVACLNLSAGALPVLAAAIDGRTTGRAFDPGVQPHVDAVLGDVTTPCSSTQYSSNRR